MDVIAKVTNSAGTIDLSHLDVSTSLGSARDGVWRDPATEAVGSILAGLGSNIMDSVTLNQTFAELGKQETCSGSSSSINNRSSYNSSSIFNHSNENSSGIILPT